MADEKPVVHPCPGAVSQAAWMNMLLTQGDGYDSTASVTLSGADLHNLIVLIARAETAAIRENLLESPLVWGELMERLDRAFVRSLRGRG